MRFVPLKGEAQLDVQALHRARKRLVAERTALINQMRALLLERGIVLAQRRRSVAAWVGAPRDENAPDCLSPRIRLLVSDMRAEWAELDRRIAALDDEFAARAAGRGGAAPCDSARHRAARRDSARGDARCACGRAGTRPGGLARAGAEAGNDRRQAEAARDHQAGQPLPAQDPDPRRPYGAAASGGDGNPPGPLATRAGRTCGLCSSAWCRRSPAAAPATAPRAASQARPSPTPRCRPDAGRSPPGRSARQAAKATSPPAAPTAR